MRYRIFGLALLLAGCSKEPPPFVTVATPALPPECEPGNPVVVRVKPDLPDGWGSDKIAVQASEAWKSAYQDTQGNRVVCWDRLQVLFPKEKGDKP
jgi:hypothetical protein